MRNLTLPLLFFISQNIFAQNPNWGWAPAITVNQNGSSISCSVVDPLTSQTQTTSESGVNSLINSDGVVAWTTSSSTYMLTYDYNEHTWKRDFWSGTDNLTNQDGIVAWQSDVSTHMAVYDPIIRTWKHDFWSGVESLINNKGVVAWQSDVSTHMAVYDPAQQIWEHDFWSGVESLTNEDGVVAWQTDVSTHMAVYDPAQQIWEHDFWSGTDNLINQEGVVAWQTDVSTHVAVFDFDQDLWEHDFWSGTDGLNVTDGTVFFSNGSSNYKKGYNFSSRAWQDNYNTSLACQLFVTRTADEAPLITYVWNLTIGANSYSYNCGDGHTITNRWAWKQYNNPGSYGITLSIFNSTSNSTCSQSVTVNGQVGIAESNEQNAIQISPNPASGFLNIQFASGFDLKRIELVDVTGRIISQQQLTKEKNGDIQLDISAIKPGLYFAKINADNRIVVRKVVIE